jgi:hypothetical protein
LPSPFAIFELLRQPFWVVAEIMHPLSGCLWRLPTWCVNILERTHDLFEGLDTTQTGEFFLDCFLDELAAPALTDASVNVAQKFVRQYDVCSTSFGRYSHGILLTDWSQ